MGWSQARVTGLGQQVDPADSCVTAGDELELIRPSVYRNVARQLSISLHSESVVTDAFLAVAAQIFTAGGSPVQPRTPPCGAARAGGPGRRAAGGEPWVALVGHQRGLRWFEVRARPRASGCPWCRLLAGAGPGGLHVSCGPRGLGFSQPDDRDRAGPESQASLAAGHGTGWMGVCRLQDPASRGPPRGVRAHLPGQKLPWRGCHERVPGQTGIQQAPLECSPSADPGPGELWGVGGPPCGG